jgi:hypothetical protein
MQKSTHKCKKRHKEAEEEISHSDKFAEIIDPQE